MISPVTSTQRVYETGRLQETQASRTGIQRTNGQQRDLSSTEQVARVDSVQISAQGRQALEQAIAGKSDSAPTIQPSLSPITAQLADDRVALRRSAGEAPTTAPAPPKSAEDTPRSPVSHTKETNAAYGRAVAAYKQFSNSAIATQSQAALLNLVA